MSLRNMYISKNPLTIQGHVVYPGIILDAGEIDNSGPVPMIMVRTKVWPGHIQEGEGTTVVGKVPLTDVVSYADSH